MKGNLESAEMMRFKMSEVIGCLTFGGGSDLAYPASNFEIQKESVGDCSFANWNLNEMADRWERIVFDLIFKL